MVYVHSSYMWRRREGEHDLRSGRNITSFHFNHIIANKIAGYSKLFQEESK